MEQHLYKDKHIYIVGCSGSGKSYMVLNYFKENCQYHLNYLSIQQISNMNDIFKYTHGSIMNMM